MPQSRKSLALALLVASPRLAQSVDVPAPVRPPAGQKMTWTGSGELTYECRAKADDAAAFDWAFAGPLAMLAGARTRAAMGRYTPARRGKPRMEADSPGSR